MSIIILQSVFKGTTLGCFLNELLDRALVQLIESFCLSDSCQVIDTELEAKFFEILRKNLFKIVTTIIIPLYIVTVQCTERNNSPMSVSP